MAETLERLLFDDPEVREAQRRRLVALQAELRAAGADGEEHLTELRARAASWPE